MSATPIIVCVKCEREMPRAARGMCRRCYKREWRSDPARRQRDREYANAWKERNRERNRARDREYSASGVCPLCGGPACIKTTTKCVACIEREVRLRRESICAMWADGCRMPEIAEFLGWTIAHLGVEFCDMRRAGWDLPYRYTMSNGVRVAS